MGMVRMSVFSSSVLIKPVILTASLAFLGACSSDFQRLSEYPSVTNTASTSQPAQNDAVSSSKLGGTSLTSNARPSWQTGYATSNRTAAVQETAPQVARATGTVSVQPGQTLYSIAKSNGLTVGKIAAANNIPAPYALRIGQRLVVPGVENPSSPSATFTPVSAAVPQKNFAGTSVHQVRAGETLFAVGRTYNIHPYKIAEHNGLAKPYSLKVGQKLRIPSGGGSTATQRQANNNPAQSQTAANTSSKAAKDQTQISQPVEKVERPLSQTNTTITTSRASDAGFRWPVRGRVISKYGSKPNGTRNEGINIAVPESADVRASDAGVVAYSGNELKGYGNLVLVRHPNGWVTAYAHSKEVFVKRGDTVRRGQVIAKAGSTGSVNSPQLHFELRKGASAVDPEKYLSSTTASN